MDNGPKKNKLFEKLNAFADWFIRLTVVNILTIIFIIPVVTIIPALTAGYQLLSDGLNKDEEPIFKGFFKYFKKDFINKMVINIILLIVFGVSIYNNRAYSALMVTNSGNLLYIIGYYITMALIVAATMITLYIPVVYSERTKIEVGQVFKLAFYLAGKFMFRTVLITLTLLIPYLMLAGTPFTVLLFVFFGITTPLIINAALTLKVRRFLQSPEV